MDLILRVHITSFVTILPQKNYFYCGISY